ncbi:methyltransferase domain-containing protein [Diaporthe amygdali]|uniref:methyltransferase domain-containing protein n=1 Tax=Phomopsis amygdali TaxID=1214568 RepID=UPI0022FE4C94|nr:methyltransferase domain-containing protein [Diaporthe amygdali]KAJ0119612.1 methyltransferase domain-containing protein [Diaporthe amygdali]
MTMLSPPGSASSSIMDQNRSPAGSSSRREAPFSGQTSSSQYPPTSAAYNTFPPTSGTAVGAPEPSPPPSLLGQAARDQASSFTSTWITPASTEDLAGDDDDNYADTDFVFENGRRYHAPASGRVVYPLPNDESEQERDDMKHKLALWMMHEKLLYSPVEESLEQGGMVLDLGTGTGEWAMDMAQRYGKSQIFGCDISPIQPAYVWDNVFFSADDFEEEWTDYPENAFDFIHMRYTAFSIKDPAALLQRIMRHLKPGGWVEFQEMTYWPRSDDNTLTDTTPYAFRDFCYYVQMGVANLGLDLHMINRLPAAMRAAGFDDVTEARHKLPIGRWARDRKMRQKGIWFLRMILMEGLSAIAKRPLTQGLGWKAEQVEMFLVDVRKSLNDTGVHAYFPFTVVYGRKPLEGGGGPVATSPR